MYNTGARLRTAGNGIDAVQVYDITVQDCYFHGSCQCVSSCISCVLRTAPRRLQPLPQCPYPRPNPFPCSHVS